VLDKLVFARYTIRLLVHDYVFIHGFRSHYFIEPSHNKVLSEGCRAITKEEVQRRCFLLWRLTG